MRSPDRAAGTSKRESASWERISGVISWAVRHKEV
jgi:hypothetical protein